MTINYIIHKIHRCAVVAIAAIALTACSDPRPARIEGTIEGMGTQNLTVVYPTETGIGSIIVTAIDEKFNFSVNLAKPSAIEFYNSSRKYMGAIVAANDDKIQLTFTSGSIGPTNAAGNKTDKQLVEFLATTDSANRNARIESYVAENPTSQLAALLAYCYYDTTAATTQHADSLLMAVDCDNLEIAHAYGLHRLLAATSVRREELTSLTLAGQGDTLCTLLAAAKPCTLLHFTSSRESLDTVGAILDTLPAGRLQAAVVRMATDTTSWSYVTKPLPRYVKRLWAPASQAEPELSGLAITALPYNIVVDSAGRELYRGTDLREAARIAASQGK